MKTVRVKVDSALCIGAACCVGILPNVFKMDEENRATVVSATPGPDPFEGLIQISEGDIPKLDDAVESCPVLAVSYESAG